MTTNSFCADMKAIFEKCQLGSHQHSQLLCKLNSLYEQNAEDFWSNFTKLLKHFLVIPGHVPAVDMTFKFITGFVIKQESKPEVESIINQLTNFLLKLLNVTNVAVRIRSSQLLALLFGAMGDDVDGRLHVTVKSAMLLSLKDKSPIVRQNAVRTLSRLQDPSNKSCSVTKEFLFHLENDPSSDVRALISNSIGATKRILPRILDRTRDVKESVRKAAYRFLVDRVHFRCLTIAQRVQTLREGLQDRADAVCKVVRSQLLPSWLKLSEDNILKFISFLDVENFTEDVELILKAHFAHLGIKESVAEFERLKEKDEMFSITCESPTCESTFYWRLLTQHVKSVGNDEMLDKLLPDLPPFCNYVRRLAIKSRADDVNERIRHEFVIGQLVALAAQYELIDEPARQTLLNLARDCLLSPTIADAIVTPFVNLLLVAVRQDETNLVSIVVEIISDLRQPIIPVESAVLEIPEESVEHKLQLAKVKVELNEARERLETAIKQEDFIAAATHKETISDLENTLEQLTAVNPVPVSLQEETNEECDSETWLKCLTIICSVLEQPVVKLLSPAIRSVVESLFLPGIQNTDPAVRNLAACGLGLACLLDKTLAIQHSLLFLQILQIDQDVVRITVAKALFDVLLTFGVDALDPDMDCDGSLVSVLTVLLDNDVTSIRDIVAEGLGKLLLLDRIVSSRLLSRLILLWYNPTTDDESPLRHFLAVFLPNYASRSRCHQRQVEEAFAPTLQTLFDAPKTSPLSNVDAYNVAKFMVALTHGRIIGDTNREKEVETTNVHYSLALRLCNFILAGSHVIVERVYCKVLLLLDCEPCDVVAGKQLFNLLKRTKEYVTDNESSRTLSKLRNNYTRDVADISNDRLLNAM